MVKVTQEPSRPARHDRLIIRIGQYAFIGGAVVSLILLVAILMR